MKSFPGPTRKRLGQAVLVVLLTATLAAGGCGPGTGSPPDGMPVGGTTITFSISVPDEEKPAIQELLDRFEDTTKADANLPALARFRNQPETRVELVTSLDAEALVRQLSEHRPGRPTVHLFAQDNLALKPLVDGELVDDLSDVEIPPAVLPAMVPPRFDGRRLFLPFRPNVRLTYLHERTAEQAGVRPPATVEELLGTAAKLRAATGRPAVTLSLADGDPAAVTVSEWVVSYGGDPLVLNDPGSVAAFQVLQQLWKDGLLATESLFGRYDTEVDHLMSGTAALAQNWSFTSAVLAKEGRLDEFHVYPGWRGPRRAAHVVGGDVLGIPRGVGGRQRAAAVALARFLMSRDAQELLVRENAWPSIRSDAYEGVPPAQRDTFAAIDEALENGWFRPSVSYWDDVTRQMNEAVDRIIVRQGP
ncbi:MAG: extracellular solute-binding protein, partial [Actinomycetota bacterium]|nr:extracellular solute-binding protein [Actinomycetota bacterium]